MRTLSHVPAVVPLPLVPTPSWPRLAAQTAPRGSGPHSLHEYHVVIYRYLQLLREAGQWIRFHIRNGDPDTGGKNMRKKHRKNAKKLVIIVILILKKLSKFGLTLCLSLLSHLLCLFQQQKTNCYKFFKAGSGSAMRKAAGSGSALRKAAGSGSALRRTAGSGSEKNECRSTALKGRIRSRLTCGQPSMLEDPHHSRANIRLF